MRHRRVGCGECLVRGMKSCRISGTFLLELLPSLGAEAGPVYTVRFKGLVPLPPGGHKVNPEMAMKC